MTDEATHPLRPALDDGRTGEMLLRLPRRGRFTHTVLEVYGRRGYIPSDRFEHDGVRIALRGDAWVRMIDLRGAELRYVAHALLAEAECVDAERGARAGRMEVA